MSRFNGDEARFNRERKQNIQRRKRNKAFFQAAVMGTAGAHTGKKPRSVSDPGKDRE